MERIRYSKLLKFISYILVPVLVLIMGISIIHIQFLNQLEPGESSEEYVQSRTFTNQYYYYLLNKLNEIENREDNYILLEDTNQVVYYDLITYGYSNNWENYIQYIFIDKTQDIIYTNLRSSDYEQEISKMANSSVYWQISNGEIQTNLEELNSENLKYNYRHSLQSNDDNFDRYEIYTSFDENQIQLIDFNIEKEVYEYLINSETSPVGLLIGSGILLLLIIIYLMWSIGYEKGNDNIKLDVIDSIPYEILSIAGLAIIAIFLSIAVEIFNYVNYLSIIVAFFMYIISYIVFSILASSTVKRIKARRFFKSFLTYKVCSWIIRKLRMLIGEFNNNVETRTKIFLNYWGFILISIILILMIPSGIGFFALIIFWCWVFYIMLTYSRQEREITKALKDIYEGKENVFIEESKLNKNLQETAKYINDIAGGFSNAIEKSLKSERMKTELITNVSHDIKTPLTSIINYVDLLKKENIQDEKVKEYIEILDQKSQRLKKLTEDLVEASKASSGNITINLEEINIKELINQAIGEFKDKFEKQNLKIETDFERDDFKIMADSRYMYRVIENLFSNISKYALENSRVYIDVKAGNDSNNVRISIKNVSKDRLNISAEELMQRFVRGDKSRYTEGSGLGLSIARSLCELQGGKFDIVIDGDLFKAVIEF